MADKRNPDYPRHLTWDKCQHEWEDVESMSDRGVRCSKCFAPGEAGT